MIRQRIRIVLSVVIVGATIYILSFGLGFLESCFWIAAALMAISLLSSVCSCPGKASLDRLANEKLIVAQAFAKCLEEYFQGECFCFDSFVAIEVTRNHANEFGCAFSESGVVRALGIVTFKKANYVTVHAITDSSNKVVDYHVAELKRYWKKGADEEILVELNEKGQWRED